MAKTKADLTKVVDKLVSVFGKEAVNVHTDVITVTDGINITEVKIVRDEQGEVAWFVPTGYNLITQPATIARRVKSNLESGEGVYPADETYDEQPTFEQLIKASNESGIIETDEQPEEENNMKPEKFLHVSKGTILTLVSRDTEAKTVVLTDEEGNEVTVKNVTLNRWYRPITKVCGELYNRAYGIQPEPKVVEEAQPVQESLGLQIVEELQQIIDEAEEVEEAPTKQPDEEARYVQLVEPDGTTTTYSYATNTWRQDLGIYPELAHKVPQGTVDNMPWFTPDNQFLGDDMRSSGDCLEEALNIPILANVLEQRECEGMEMTELTVMEIVTEALHLLDLSKTPESQLYEMLHSGGETLQQHTANQLERIQEFVDRWMEVKF